MESLKGKMKGLNLRFAKPNHSVAVNIGYLGGFQIPVVILKHTVGGHFNFLDRHGAYSDL